MELAIALIRSGFGAKYATSSYAPYGQLNDESVKLILRVAALEQCSAALLAHAWMNESSFRFYPPPNTNVKKDPNNIHFPEKWDHGPMQINREIYEKNVAVKWFKALPVEQVFGTEFYLPGTLEPYEFTGNPLFNLRAGARHLARIGGDWQGEGFKSLDAMKAGKFTGGDRVQWRANNWLEWGPYLTSLFELYSL